MVNEAILGALQSALARGESLKKAMMTVYNAGYKREEISEAARLINNGGTSPQAQPIQQQPTQQAKEKQPQQSATAQMLAPSSKLSPKSQKPKQPFKQIQQPQMFQQPPVIPPQTLQQPQVTQQQVQQPLTQQQMQQPLPNQNTPQKVSVYGLPPEQKSKTTIILLGFLLLFLIGTLVTIFLFKQELLDFFNNLFS